MYLYGEKEKLVSNHLKKALTKGAGENEEAIKLIEILKKYREAGYNKKMLVYEELAAALWNENTKSMEEIFEGDKYRALQLLFDDENARKFKNIWNKAANYIYSIDSYRRSYKSKKASKLYLHKNINKLEEFIYLTATGFSLDKYLQGDTEDYGYIDVISDLIALEIDNNNEKVLQQLKEVIYSDNNTAIVTREIIRGLLMSESDEAHKMIGDLFLAAKLQEGLRQAIVESLDEGSRKGFIYILKLIIDNNLIRFSSVVRAFCTWTGLNLEVEKPKVIKKSFESIYNALTDEEYKKSCITSDENILIYIGLWAIAFDEIEDTEDILKDLLQGDIKYKKLIALEFLYQTQSNGLMHKAACEMLEESDLEVIAAAVRNMFSNLNCYSLTYNIKRLKEYEALGNNYYGKELFDKIKRIIDIMPKKEIKYSEVVFPWVNISLNVNELMEKLIFSVGMTKDNDTIDTFIDYKDKMDINTRVFLIDKFLKKPKNSKQRNALIEACGDKSELVRTAAFKIVKAIKLNDEDYRYIENLLKYKYGDLRKSAINLLMNQESYGLVKTVKNLAVSKEENRKLAAIEIVNSIEKDLKHKEIFEECLEYVAAIDDTLKNNKLSVNDANKDEKDYKNFKNGFGLYDPSKEYIPQKVKKNKKAEYKFSLTYEDFMDLFNKFSSFIKKHREFEYEVIEWDGGKNAVTLGGSDYLIPLNRNNREAGLNNYPIADEIRKFAKENKLEGWSLMEFNFYVSMIDSTEYAHYPNWYEKFLEEIFNHQMFKKLKKAIKKTAYYHHIKSYVYLLEEEISKVERFKISKAIVQNLYEIIPAEKHLEEYSKKDNQYTYYNYRNNTKDYISAAPHINHWLNAMLANAEDDKSFSDAFNITYNYYKASNYYTNLPLDINHFGRALELGIIDDNEALKEILERPTSPSNIYSLTVKRAQDKDEMLSYKKILALGKTAANVVAEIEANRGDLDTEVTPLASQIAACYGVSIFTTIIINSEKDTYVRGYNYIGGNCTKKSILSKLLKCCYPKEGENVDDLKKALSGKKVTTKQLIEAAMYSPQWLDIIAEYLGYDGLKSACWYFHAHVNDYFSYEKAAIVARYTPIDVEDLKDGAFDQQWFREAYNTIGEKNFKVVYDSAKYIAGGSLHKRSQLFADATLGKLKLKDVLSRVKEKRNKDYLLTFGLIPVKNKKDVLGRYEYIQQFIKESKKFGAQRQASEGRSAKIALLNLARNAGFSDVNRLIWNMETAKIQEVLSYLESKTIEDVEVKLVIDELGQADILCTKAGKELKSIPTKLKKNEYILEINNLKKSLKDQYVRARKSFEEAMENGENFKGEELAKLCKNPVLSPIIKNLLFKAGDFIGYLQEDTLIDYKNNSYKFKEKEDVIIVHPIHLYEAKVWHEYQKDIFSKKLVQPFKQAFRELYLPNSDELKEQTLSRRYAGHQVQPKKTLALLKTRGWMASDEEGLQKVYYKENIIATIYAEADWCSPADMESPVIEFVRFEDRKTYKPVTLDTISKLIFSEVMRDMDLVVSVAHVGGVDPEASLSTIEIRTVIVEEILKLMKISNVKLKGSHAFINGAHGEYTVHLGSGVVHKMGVGSINIVSVPSSHRGKIFLPFIDSDPRSSEIITKITLLAEDTKIKDPSILEQIKL